MVQLWFFFFLVDILFSGFPGGARGKEPACQCRRHKRHRFDPWVGKILLNGTGHPTPGFLPGESHGQRSLAGYCPQAQRVGHNWATKHILFQDAKTITQNGACLAPSLLVDYPKPNPKSRTVTKFFNSNKCQTNPDSGQILLLSEATVSKFQERNWKEVHPKVWLKVIRLVVMDSTKSSGGRGAAGRETYI